MMRRFSPQRLLDDRSAATSATVAIALPALIAAAALAIDMGVGFVIRTGLQNTADAAALAGVSALPDTTAATSRAISAATANMPVAAHGAVLVAADVRSGNWNEGTRVFTANQQPLNAVEVITRRAAANNNALPSFLAGIFGRSSFNVNARAIATIGGGGIDDCLLNGFLADGNLEVGSKVTIQGDTCVHGQGGIKVGSNVTISNPAEVTYGEGKSLVQGSNNNIHDPHAENKTILADGQVDAMLAAISTGSASAPQPNWDQTWTIDSKPNAKFTNCNPADWTLYIRKEVDLSSCSGTLENFAVYGDSIKLPSGSSSNPVQIRNMYFASKSWIETGSNLDFGSSDFCDTGDGSVFLIAKTYIKLGSDIRMWGVQMMAGGDGRPPAADKMGIEFGDDFETTAVAAWSDGYLKLGSAPNVDGSDHEACDQDDHIRTHTADLVLKLVK